MMYISDSYLLELIKLTIQQPCHCYLIKMSTHFMHNVEKWPTILLKSCGVNTAIILKYVRPFLTIMHERAILAKDFIEKKLTQNSPRCRHPNVSFIFPSKNLTWIQENFHKNIEQKNYSTCFRLISSMSPQHE